MITPVSETRRGGGRSSHPLELEARELMTPGVVSITEDATLHQVYRALLAHGVHALLVVGRHGGRPLGWVTARGLLGWLDKDESLSCARDAITQDPVAIEPGAGGREALVALSQPGITHLLVQRGPDVLPEGVISTLDLVPPDFD